MAFHAFMRGALAQAHAEHLVDAEVLASADADVQIVGPSIALYLAALRSTGSPPSISTPHITLSEASSPPSLLRFVQLWAGLVPRIQALSEEHQHDLARLICDLEPESQPILGSLPGLAQDIRAVAIEISQRRTFQERFNEGACPSAHSMPCLLISATQTCNTLSTAVLSVGIPSSAILQRGMSLRRCTRTKQDRPPRTAARSNLTNPRAHRGAYRWKSPSSIPDRSTSNDDLHSLSPGRLPRIPLTGLCL